MQGKRDFRSQKKDLKGEYDRLSGAEKDQFQCLKQETERYKGKNQAELMQELQKRVAKGKQEGTLNADMVEQFKNQVSPMLDGEQRKRMESLVNMMKGQL